MGRETENVNMCVYTQGLQVGYGGQKGSEASCLCVTRKRNQGVSGTASITLGPPKNVILGGGAALYFPSCSGTSMHTSLQLAFLA